MIVAGLDLESDGLAVDKNRVTEVGIVIWDTDSKRPLKIFSLLVNDPDAEITEDTIRTTGITQDDLRGYGADPERVYRGVVGILGTPGLSAIVAHNGNDFDRPMLRANMARFGMALPDLPWIDTMTDLPYPDTITTRKLVHLAAEHGFLNPFAHRAVFDVLTMLHVFSRYDAGEALRICQEPFVTLVATVLPPWRDEGKSTSLAKEHGFRWDPAARTWSKRVRSSQHKPDQAYPFRVDAREYRVEFE